MFVGLEAIANLIGRCAIYEILYLNSETEAARNLEKALIGLYVWISLTLVRAKQSYSGKTGKGFFASGPAKSTPQTKYPW